MSGEDSKSRTPASFKYCIFDLDGTLLDFEGASHIGLARGLKGAGLPEEAMAWELHGSIIGMTSKAWSKKLLEALEVPPEKLSPEQYLEAYNEVMHDLHADLKLMPFAQELIDRLKANGVHMAIATSSNRTAFETKMSFHPKIVEAMDYVVCGDDEAVKEGKPAPDIFLEAARQLGADPAECAIFEDAPSGCKAGRAAGGYVVVIPDKRFDGVERDYSGADRIVSSLEEWYNELPTSE
mmetsp:Transcript_18812/g.28291  ORF Transcript_18812/g.28291 Transcript_18812/m.28291 type:complete len:238 (+) Transcript_18812:78-791(+)|eukprot:CAMPEP_0206474354 /NCGR_PEP_ID=MMETSP0324_2-20121206/33436_1 /ASSEMBLY_ACC=CAM_ASM_000836 /TAXON_ID=2866 /ORGANISM="Crypthecodinium cohnii, Strain Seligo" /LENGTH=237 /DNA_ID=CAMNT_0053949509 /DNA_START=88 /DNA_END=801 /DNA_ORIENTATION=+